MKQWVILPAALLVIAGSAFLISYEVWVWSSGIIAGSAMAATLLPRRRRRGAATIGRDRPPALYGESDWATKEDMRASGITSQRR
jgi:hypothetical protein